MSTEIDFSSLEKEFDLESHMDDQFSEMRNRLKNIDDQGDSNTIIKLNIERANYLLDLAEQEFKRGSFNARMLEACGKIIAEITNAANSLKSIEIQTQTIDIKERTLNLKEFEVKNKIDIKESGQNTYNTNNILITDRESLLKMINSDDQNEIQEIQCNII